MQNETNQDGVDGAVERLLGTEQVAQMLGISVRCLWRRVANQKFMKPAKLGRLSKWRQSDVLRFINGMFAGTSPIEAGPQNGGRK